MATITNEEVHEIPESGTDDDSEEEIQNDNGNGVLEVTVQATAAPPPAEPPTGTPQLPNLALTAIQRLREANKRQDESPDDFRPLKRRRVYVKTGGEGEVDENEEVDEGQCCSICLEPWSNSGIHRIASLKCGHLFGYGCIDKWLKAQDGRCPQCNSKARKKDIRVIFAKSISVLDTTERDRALKDLEEEKGLKIQALKSEAQSLLQYQLVKAECDRVKLELKDTKAKLEEYVSGRMGSHGNPGNTTVPMVTTNMSTNGNGSFKHLKTININGSSRVMAHDTSLGMIVASKKSTNQLYRGYGLSKISLLDLKPSEFVPVHGSAIRDVVFSPRGDGLTLTVGVDKTMKLTSMHSNAIVQSYSLPSPAWACTWNPDDPNHLYCGLSNGTVMTFDLRQTTGHVTELKIPNRSVPVTSLSYVPLCRASCLNCSGILMGTLEGTVFWEKEKESFTPHALDNISECELYEDTLPRSNIVSLLSENAIALSEQGACVSVSFESASRHCLASFRPSRKYPMSRHILCQLQNTPLTDPFACNTLHQFDGGSSQKLLSRSILFQKPDSPGKLMVAYGNEQSNSTHVCDFSSAKEFQVLRTGNEPCIDMSLVGDVADGHTPLLTLLTGSKLHVNKWTQH